MEKEAADGLSFVEGMRLLAGAPRDLNDAAQPRDAERDWSFVHAGDWLSGMLEGLRSPENLQHATPGADFKAILRGYQETGVNWLWFLANLGLGACLADDMGLGKTVQVIGLLTALKKKSAGESSLLVLPASLLGNWKAEIGPLHADTSLPLSPSVRDHERRNG